MKQEIIKSVEKGKANSKALDVKITFKYPYPPLKLNTNSPEIQRMKKVIQIVHNLLEERIQIIGMPMTFDVAFVA